MLTDELKFGWVKVKNEWVTEISNQPKRCPVCGDSLLSAHMISITKDQENDILSTLRECPCGARLVLLND